MRATYLLIAICVAVFAMELAGGAAFLPGFVLSPVSLLAEPWAIITSLFAHADIEHILFNMLALFMFGSVLEARLGPNRFLFLYLVSGVVGAVGFMLFNPPFELALGASGAIYGIIGALVLLEPKLTVYFYGVPIPMYVAGPIYALIEVFAMGSTDSIAHSAHLLGFFAGLALATQERQAWPPKPPMELWKALAIPIALSLLVAVGFGAYYLSDALNRKMLSCEGAASAEAAKACLLDLSKEYKNSPQQQGYICDEYERLFRETGCRGV